MEALIVSGGNTDDILLCNLIKTGGYELVVAADSGLEALYRNHVTPDMVVGDFDSVDQEILSFYRNQEGIHFVELERHKDDTDTEHAIREAITFGAKKITILGATGNRLDHVLGNIALLGIGLERYAEMEMLDTHNRIRLINKGMTLKKNRQWGNYVSLLPYAGPVEDLYLKGFAYNTEGITLSPYNSLGISNEITEEEASIEFSKGVLLVMETRD